MPLRRPSCAALSRRFAAALLPALLPALLAACEHKPAVPHPDSSATAVPSAAGASAPTADRSGWDHAAGPALLVQGAALDEAIVVYPFVDDTIDQAHLDSAGTNGGSALLFGRGGTRLSARLGALPDETESSCERWLLRDVRPQGAGTAWSVGFVDAQVAPVALDSVDVLSPRDSVALAAEASRLASAVTAPTGPSFQGLRFTVHDVRRFQAAQGVQAFVAHLIRHVNQEANPQEEQTLIIAERDSGAAARSYSLVYAERSFGLEDSVTTPEVLAGVRLGSSPQPTLIVARDNDSGVVYTLLERTGPGHWRTRWTSPPAQCSPD